MTATAQRPATKAQVERIGEMIGERIPDYLAEAWITAIAAKIERGAFTRHDAAAAFRCLRPIPPLAR
jgi:hypothetical protein